MNDLIPAFGDQLEGAKYVLRPGGYVIIERMTGEIAVIETPGGWYLPGGGQNSGETAEQAAVRETAEECGLRVRLIEKLGVADQLLYAAAEATHFRKRCAFFRGEVIEGAVSDSGDGGEVGVLRWVTPEDAASRLLHESQRWALAQACRKSGS